MGGGGGSVAFFDAWSVAHVMWGLIFVLVWIAARKLGSVSHRHSAAVSLLVTVLAHQLWEAYENSAGGVRLMRRAGERAYAGDSTINSIGDTFFCVLGCALVYGLVTASDALRVPSAWRRRRRRRV